jgi:hypothetical protein
MICSGLVITTCFGLITPCFRLWESGSRRTQVRVQDQEVRGNVVDRCWVGLAVGCKT